MVPPPRGGARPNSGRPRLSPDEPTAHLTLRVPASWLAAIREHHLSDDVRAAIGRLLRRRRVLPKPLPDRTDD